MSSQHLDPARLRALRVAAGLTQPATARAIGRSTSTLVRYEVGELDPPVSVITALADVLGVNIGELFTGTAPVSA